MTTTTEAVERVRAFVRASGIVGDASQLAQACSVLLSRLEELEGALMEIADQAANQDLSHVNFRVGAEAIARFLLPQQQEGKQ